MSGSRVLIVFDTVEGHTAKIADRIADRLRTGGVVVEVFRPASASSPGEADAAILGDSIHLGHHSSALVDYASEYSDELASMPSALFQVSLTSVGHSDADERTTHGWVDELSAASGWTPDLVGLFGGALAYTKYGWVKRRMLAHIAAERGLSTDTKHDTDYTDWDAVDAFADEFLALVGSQAVRSP